MSRPSRTLVPTLLALLALAAGGVAAQDDPAPTRVPRPTHVVFVLVDDLGWRDLGCYGSELHRTPHIDRLAAEGVRFTDAHAAHAMCMASRLGLVTGRHPARTRTGDGGGDRSAQTLIGEAFQAAGYATFLAGKWHLHRGGLVPEREGFDVVVGTNEKGGVGSHFPPYGDPGAPDALPDLVADVRVGEDLAARLTREALGFLRTHRDEPCFVYLSHYAVHRPLQADPEVVARYRADLEADPPPLPRRGKLGRTNPLLHQENPTYAAMVEAVDASVGTLVAGLEELGMLDDTLLVVTSDNGGAVTSTSNAPLRGGKMWLFEGGTRVPLVVRHPTLASGGRVTAHPTVGTDHYPSLLELAGLEPLPEQHLDGRSYAPALREGPQDLDPRPLFWHFPVGKRLQRTTGNEPCSAVRLGHWKLVEWYERDAVELHDLRSDPGEARDLAAEQPEVTADLRSRLRAWRAEVRAPMQASEDDLED